jgi:TonB family protein
MKFKIFFLVLFCISSISFVNASEPSIMIKSVLSEKVKYPQKAIDLLIEGTVTITFKIDNSGKILVKEISSNSDVLKNDVLKQLEIIKVDPDTSYEVNTYSIMFKFELIK